MADQSGGQSTAQDLRGTYYFMLTLGDVAQAGYFKECSGLTSESSVVENRAVDAKGKPMVQKMPGQMQWSNITLKRGIDAKDQLWTWRKKILDGKINEARMDGQIDVVDWEGTAVITYKFVRGWPCRYASPPLNAAGDEALVEEIEIAHEGFERVTGGGGG
jgi:phage tail-like protein